ncbi:MAG: hypothetical protein HUJ76_04915, partial [Parasporobacterium sp.]|nr:hypothetical protein [Parasporobacterium sp.]
MKRLITRASAILMAMLMVVTMLAVPVSADEYVDDSIYYDYPDDFMDEPMPEDDTWQEENEQEEPWSEPEPWTEETWTEDTAPETIAEPETEACRTVATADGTDYYSMLDAVNNIRDGAVLMLQEDIILTNPVDVRSSYNFKFTIDLNGHEIRMYGTDENMSGDNSGADPNAYPDAGGMFILRNGTLTFTDSSYEKNGRITSSNDRNPVIRVVKDTEVGTYLYITGGTYKSHDSQPVIRITDQNDQELPSYESSQDSQAILTVSVSDGRFSRQLPAEFMAPGRSMKEDSDGTWITEEAKAAVYNINWMDWDGTLLQTAQVNEGDVPDYSGDTPYRSEDDSYTYSFTGWSPEPSQAYSDAEYTAVYEATPKETAPAVYAVSFSTEMGAAPDIQYVEEGSSAYDPGHPDIEGYNFEGWYEDG